MELTRRGLIGRAAAVTGAVLGGSLLAPRVVFAGDAGEAVFEMRMPGGRGPVATHRPFELIGIDGAGTGSELRTRGLDGRWSEWLPLHAGDGHAPDAARDGSGSDAVRGSGLSDPVWTGAADAFDVRSKHSLRGARVVLVDAGRRATASAKRFIDAGLPAGPGQPPVIARSSWATAACRPRVAAALGAIDLAFVHHTVSTNGYRPSQSAAMVRSICLFHKYGNGWDDIGYNFVVDRYGQIFEARAGGIDEAIVGAQAGGYNTYSSGIALLGNFTGHGPPKRAFDALARLLAWKLAIHGIELPGSTTVTVTRSGGPYSRYRPGSRVLLNRISGHRDGDATSCPGAGMYRQLPRLRHVVQRQLGTVGALGLQAVAAAPGSASVAGTLTAAGVPVAGATIELQRRSSRSGPTTLATAVTDAGGAWSVTAPLATNASLRAVYRGDPAHQAVISPGVSVVVPPQIALNAATSQAPPGGVIQFTGSVTPVKRRLLIVIAKQQPDGSFAIVRSINLKPAQDGSFTRTIGFPDAGQYQVLAHTAADASNGLGTSASVAITIA